MMAAIFIGGAWPYANGSLHLGRLASLLHGPEKRDTDFSWREFIHSHNGELLGAFGNFVNRTLAFIDKSFGGRIPQGQLNGEWKTTLELAYKEAGQLIEEGHLKEALERIFANIRRANKYFDERKPWVQVIVDLNACGDTLHTCVQIIANLANLLNPFLPFSCEKIRKILTLEQPAWQMTAVPDDRQIQDLELLFERIDPGRIDMEVTELRKATE
ncbi:class I tRNA ligase family protein [Paenibacillus sp. MBLB4367]|uniref:class I tRNA ligase family protein n=1 Tax=Paenibacillus sp. MBLB4367 TaxID=3384767 RepID=UPI00390815E7